MLDTTILDCFYPVWWRSVPSTLPCRDRQLLKSAAGNAFWSRGGLWRSPAIIRERFVNSFWIYYRVPFNWHKWWTDGWVHGTFPTSFDLILAHSWLSHLQEFYVQNSIHLSSFNTPCRCQECARFRSWHKRSHLHSSSSLFNQRRGPMVSILINRTFLVNDIVFRSHPWSLVVRKSIFRLPYCR